MLTQLPPTTKQNILKKQELENSLLENVRVLIRTLIKIKTLKLIILLNEEDIKPFLVHVTPVTDQANERMGIANGDRTLFYYEY